MATDHRDIERAIIKGVNAIIAQVTGVTEKILSSLKKYVKSIKPTLEMGSDGVKLVLEPSMHVSATENICEALQILNAVLEKNRQKAVLLMDEFQEVERVAKDQGIEGAIRHVVQETKNFSVIFSGSKRHLLKSMFNDRNKPLYRLCDEIALERIGAKEYEPFLKPFSLQKWNKVLSENAFMQLMVCTERHPYYVNALLRVLFLHKTLPDKEDVVTEWLKLAERKKEDLFHETDTLSIVQRKLLIAIAKGPTQEFTSKDFLSAHKLAASTVIKNLNNLMAEDFIEKIHGHYSPVDPLLKTVIEHVWA